MLWVPSPARSPPPHPARTIPPCALSIPPPYQAPETASPLPFPQPRPLSGSFPRRWRRLLFPPPFSLLHRGPPRRFLSSAPGTRASHRIPAPQAPDSPGVPHPARGRPRTSPHLRFLRPLHVPGARLQLQPRHFPALGPPRNAPGSPVGPTLRAPGPAPRPIAYPIPLPGSGERKAGPTRGRRTSAAARGLSEETAKAGSSAAPPSRPSPRRKRLASAGRLGRADRALGAAARGLAVGGEVWGQVPAPGGSHPRKDRFLSAQGRPQAFCRECPPSPKALWGSFAFVAGLQRWKQSPARKPPGREGGRRVSSLKGVGRRQAVPKAWMPGLQPSRLRD